MSLAAIRERVLAAWAASPARFREDANAEADASAGSPLVEIAQNAADAAVRAGVPGRLLVEVVDGTLYAANAGAPLDEAGVEALCHLRASAKTSGTGRYGVGFKAVLSVTDSPAVFSRGLGVAWSRERTLEVVAAIPSLREEVERRRGEVPVMRLPWEAVPDEHAAALLREWDTVVVLPLTAPVDLAEIDEWLLMTLPLSSVTAGSRVLTPDPSWHVHTVTGTIPADLLADRPVEERERSGWSVTVALPAPEDRLLRAPQPAGERVDVPMFLSVSVPLEPSRRHVVHGPLTEWLAQRAAEAYVEFLESLPKTPEVLDLVPSTLPAGAFDLMLREALAPLLAEARVFPEGRRAVLDLGPASAAVTEVLDLPLLGPEWLRKRPALRALGVRVLETADVVDLLHGMSPPSWAAVYEALAHVPDRDALRALPVPLADGRVVTGPRGLLIPGDPEAMVAGLRWIDPAACAGIAGEVLRGAGAVDADPATLLDELRPEVEDSLDAEDPSALAGAVLGLLRSSPTAAEGREWLGGLALPDASGDLRAADELLLPGSPVVGWVREDSPFAVAAGSLLEAYGADALVACGVVASLSPRDYDEVRPAAWAEALGTLADPDLDWLRENVVLPAASGALLRPRALLAPDADPLLDGLYERAAALPEASLRMALRLGLVTSVDDLDDDGLADLADRLAERGTLDQARALYAALARRDVPLDPSHVRAVRDGDLVTVPVGEAFAVDRPDHLPLLAGRAWLPVDVTLGRALADVLGVRLATESGARVTSSPVATEPGYDVHAPLLVEGLEVAWWADPPCTDGTVRGLARLRAWRSGSWPSRHAIEASLRGERDDESLLDPS